MSDKMFVLIYVKDENDMEKVEREIESIKRDLDILYLDNKLFKDITIATGDKRYFGEEGLKEFVEYVKHKNINTSSLII